MSSETFLTICGVLCYNFIISSHTFLFSMATCAVTIATHLESGLSVRWILRPLRASLSSRRSYHPLQPPLRFFCCCHKVTRHVCFDPVLLAVYGGAGRPDLTHSRHAYTALMRRPTWHVLCSSLPPPAPALLLFMHSPQRAFISELITTERLFSAVPCMISITVLRVTPYCHSGGPCQDSQL